MSPEWLFLCYSWWLPTPDVTHGTSRGEHLPGRVVKLHSHSVVSSIQSH